MGRRPRCARSRATAGAFHGENRSPSGLPAGRLPAMPPQRQVRADYDAQTIVVYQAYPPAIADRAVQAQRFVAPFSFRRMTWIKPSFLWLMHRSNWAGKPGQDRILAVRITRDGWEQALSQAVLTTADPAAVAQAAVHVQWDPE